MDSALHQDDHAVGVSSGQVQIVQCEQGDGPGTVEYYVYSALVEEVFAIENRSGPGPYQGPLRLPEVCRRGGPGSSGALQSGLIPSPPGRGK